MKKKITKDIYSGLSARQLRFVNEYIIDLNGTQAAIRAGYNPHTARVQAAKMLTLPSMQEAVTHAKSSREKRTQVTQDMVVNELAKIAFADPRKFYNSEGDLKNITDLDDDTAASLAAFDQHAAPGGEGSSDNGNIKKIRMSDKRAALEVLGKHLGMFTGKIELTGADGGPIVQQITRKILKKEE